MSTSRPFAATAALCLTALLVACGGAGADSGSEAGSTAKGAAQVATAAAPAAGEKIYQQRCVSCHQLNGKGTPGVFPPLAGSEFANAANPGVPARVVMHGLQGPITVDGVEYNSVMPPYGIGIVMKDEEIAAVLTYVRSSFGNSASAVTAADVHEAREESEDHTGAMTAELLKPLMMKKK